MRFLILFALLFQVGCATKYILPGNKFMTPESQGGAFNSQFEFQQTSANQLTADLSNSSASDGVTYGVVRRSGFAFSTSMLDQIDFFLSHTGSGNSLFGGKFQFLGASRTAKGTGHKMALTAAIGANEHKIEGADSIEFELSGQEYQLLYGFRFSELILTYANLSYANYKFIGDITSSNASINGIKMNYATTMYSLLSGMELTFGSFFGKLECGYQQLATTDTEDEAHFIYGYALGFSW